ncbi:MAG: amidohydrolase [Anaerolineales bacterium]
MAQSFDLLIQNGHVFTETGWLSPGYVVVDSGCIRQIKSGEAPQEIVSLAKRVINALGMAVIPGLTNAHTHLCQTFMRGLANGRPLLSWLKELIWPLQAAMGSSEVALAAMLGLVENLHSGVTHVVNHHKITHTLEHTQVVCQAAQKIGIRCTIARAWSDRGSGAEGQRAILDELEELFSTCHNVSPLIRIANGPLTPWRATAETLQRTHALAQHYNSFTHIHVAETRDEVQMTLNETGLRPIVWLDSLGVLGEDCQVVHAVWVDEQEVSLLRERKSSVIHCPVSNAVLGSGIAPLTQFLQEDIQVLMGTDGSASNDTQDLFETMKMALCFGRVKALDPMGLSPRKVLEMGLAGKSIRENQPADLVLIELDSSHTAPVHDIDSALILCSRSSDVHTVIVDGKIVLENHQICALDEKALIQECNHAAKKLLERAGIS